MVNFFKYLFIIFFLVLNGCVSPPTIYATIATVGESNISIKGESFEVLALDFQKSSDMDYQSLRTQVIQELTKKGMVYVNGIKVEPRYLVLLDYAVDIAEESPFERRFLAITYDSRSRQLVHKIRVTSKGTSSNIGEIFPSIIRQVYSVYPEGKGFENLNIRNSP